jgi:hypothetical protein
VRQLSVILVASVTVAFGCGYKLIGYDEGFGDIRTIAIRTPDNDSYEPGVETIVADALRREFLRRGAVQVVSNPSTADLVLDGSVRSVQVSGRSFSSVIFTLEYELVMVLDLAAVRSDGTPLYLGQRSLTESEFYLASADVEAMRKNRQEALRRVAGLLAQRVHDSLFEAATR